jgi:hypothetical protein
MTFPVTSFSKNFYLVPIVFPHFTGFFVFQLLAALGSPVSVVGVLFILSMCSGFLNFSCKSFFLHPIHMYRVILVLPPEQKHPLLIDLKFSKNSGMIVEHSVKISNFLMKQVNISF